MSKKRRNESPYSVTGTMVKTVHRPIGKPTDIWKEKKIGTGKTRNAEQVVLP